MIQYLDADQQRALLEQLVQRSESREQVWTVFKGDFEFKTNGKKYFYYISCRDEDDLPPHAFEIWRDESDQPASEPSEDSPILSILTDRSQPELNDLLVRLYRAAKIRALDIDTVSAELLSDLD